MESDKRARDVLEEAVKALGGDAGVICDVETDKCQVVTLFNIPQYYEKLSISKELCLGAESIETGKPVVKNDYPYYKPVVPMQGAALRRLKALVCAPIFVRGALVAAISILSFSQTKRFTEDDGELLGKFAERLAQLPPLGSEEAA